jgi:ABC-type branched-subunit amino acid transport system substrate-binding protein
MGIKMIKFKIGFLFFVGMIVLGIQSSLAQSSEAQKFYLSGKESFQNKHYQTAEVFFGNCLKVREDNPFMEYASFYFALSSYHAGDLPKAKNMLLQIKERYSTWSQMDEVYFWLFRIDAESDLYFTALNYFESIKNKKIKEQAEPIREELIASIEEVATLKRLQETYPQDQLIAIQLVNQIARQPAGERDVNLQEQLIAKFKITPEEISASYIPPTVKKSTYSVGVIMPFFLKEVMPYRDDLSNPFVFELIEGMEMAKSDLEEQGKKLNFFYFDNENSIAKTREILQNEDLKKMDLLVSPLFPHTSELVARFGLENRIVTFNPISNTSTLVTDNPYSFLFKPSVEDMAASAASYVKEHLYNKNAMVYYGNTSKDSLLAAHYIQLLRADSFKIVWVEKVEPNNSRKILDRLTEKYQDEFAMDVFEISMDSVGHIFVASENELIAANVISGVEIRGDKIPLIGFENWLGFKFVSYEQLERIGAILIAPNFVNYSSSDLSRFRERYFSRAKKMPTDFTINGYESILFFGKMLFEEGIYFQPALQSAQPQRGKLLLGMDYRESQSNKLVPLIKIENALIRNLTRRDGTFEVNKLDNE